MTRNLPNILVTGTPGVGKTTMAKLLVGYIDGE
jgi:broad-specificity NMP kinase